MTLDHQTQAETRRLANHDEIKKVEELINKLEKNGKDLMNFNFKKANKKCKQKA